MPDLILESVKVDYVNMAFDESSYFSESANFLLNRVQKLELAYDIAIRPDMSLFKEKTHLSSITLTDKITN